MATTNEPLTDVPERSEPRRNDDGDRGQAPHHKHSLAYWVVFAVLVLTAAVLIYFFAWLPRHKQTEEINKQAQTEQNALPRIQVMKVRSAPGESELQVPGTTQAYTEANIYARASGYLTRRVVDIGDHVHAGQLLAIIDAPDLDQEVAQARSSLRQSESNLAQMEAQLHLNSLNWDRYKVLVARGVLSRQEGDTQEANYRVAEANVRAAENTVQANRDSLERLVVLQGYERVTAPFDGVVIARNVDVGTLITAQGTGVASSSATLPGTTQAGAEGNNAGSSGNVTSATTPSTGGSQGGAMFTIADTSVFRILVSVPEAYSSLARVGQSAALMFQEVPGERFMGRVTRTSSAIDANTRTLLVEVQVRNHRNLLMSGMYAQVNLIQTKTVPPLLIPGEAIAVRNGNNVVAQVEGQVVHFRPIAIGRDYGDQTEVTSGLKAGDVVALDVTDAVQEGAKIQPDFAPEKPQTQTRGGQSDNQPNTEGQYGNQNLSNQGAQKGAAGKRNPTQKGGGGPDKSNSGKQGSSARPTKQ